jgi:hypothetical protein
LRVAGVEQFGGPVLTLEVGEPRAPGQGEVLIEVTAAGVGNWDAVARVGEWDLGPDVEQWSVGDDPGQRSLPAPEMHPPHSTTHPRVSAPGPPRER